MVDHGLGTPRKHAPHSPRVYRPADRPEGTCEWPKEGICMTRRRAERGGDAWWEECFRFLVPGCTVQPKIRDLQRYIRRTSTHTFLYLLCGTYGVPMRCSCAFIGVNVLCTTDTFNYSSLFFLPIPSSYPTIHAISHSTLSFCSFQMYLLAFQLYLHTHDLSEAFCQ